MNLRERAGGDPGWSPWLAPEPIDVFPPLSARVAQLPEEFLAPLGRLVVAARRRLRAALRTISADRGDDLIDAESLEASLFEGILPELCSQLGQSFALELNVARLRGLLAGATAEERYRAFIRSFDDEATIEAFAAEYQVLAGAVQTTLSLWVEANAELLHRLAEDVTAVHRELAPEGATPHGAVVEIHTGGDHHARGRAVAIVHFASGWRVVYKPRRLDIDIHFAELLAWLGRRAEGAYPSLRVARVVSRGEYGWVEYVEHAACENAAEVTTFYRRLGAWLGVLYAVHATDFHLENLIAAGEHPVIIDLETLFHPPVDHGEATSAEDAAMRRLNASVFRVGILPSRMEGDAPGAGLEISGMGGASGQTTPFPVPRWESEKTDALRLARRHITLTGASNRPTLRGEPLSPLDHEDALTAGFRAMYETLRANRDDLLLPDGPLAAFENDPVRVVLRPTREYSVILRESYHPDLLRDAADRDHHFDALRQDIPSERHMRPLEPAERAALWRGDIPIFLTRGGSRNLTADDGEVFPDFLGSSGLDAARAQIRRLGDEDLKEQLWLVRASFTTLDEAYLRHATGSPAPARDPARSGELVSAARSIGEEILRRAIRCGDDVTWLGVVPRGETFSVATTDANLYDGTAGIAFFLAQLGAVTGEAQFEDAARAALRTVQRQLRAAAGASSVGAFAGWGSAIWTLGHLGSLYGDDALLDAAESLAGNLPSLVAGDEAFDVIDGAAGAAFASMALLHARPNGIAREATRACAAHLLSKATLQGGGLAWPVGRKKRALAGFAHGSSGIGAALLRAGETLGEPRFVSAGLSALRFERSMYSETERNWPDVSALSPSDPIPERSQVAWCHGAPGVALGRVLALGTAGLGAEDTRALDQELDVAVTTTLERGVDGSHCLCHGGLGNLEILLRVADAASDAALRTTVMRSAAGVLESSEQRGWLSGVPLWVETPGLMAGLSGIGLGLLRLASPGVVPSVLALDLPAAT